MSGFHALNIESDDESDIEVDDTKEIQIEEALKLYQIALRYHSEGPDSFEKASLAYQQLFDSEIFKYPESQAELQRIELYGAAPENESLWDDVAPGSVTASNSLDTGPSTLPQVLHLSHKNYAQFKLDALEAKFDIFNVTLNQILVDALSALNHFVEALDKDDSDIDLWRRTASVGEILDSRRVARYCLESVLDGDDDGLNSVLSLPGLEEGSAGEKLRDLVGSMQDSLSLLQSPLSNSKRRVLSQLLRERLHPYFDILQREIALREQEETPATQQRDRLVLKPPKTWAEMGDAILRQFVAEQHGTSSTFPGIAISFDLSTTPNEDVMVIEQPASPDEPEPSDPTARLTSFPTTIHEQFPGLDYGKPTAQPQIAPADPSMLIETRTRSDSDVNMINSPTMTLPSRKRSGDAAGLNDGSEESRTKSRRTRARESHVETGDTRQALIDANTRWEYEQHLNEFQAADDWMFETVGNLFEKVGIVGFGAAKNIRQEMQSAPPEETFTPAESEIAVDSGLRHARSDLQAFLSHYNEQLAHLLRNSGESLDISQSMSAAGNMFTSGGSSKSLVKMPVLPDDGLQGLLQSINEDWTLTQDAARKFIGSLLYPGSISSSTPGNSYTQYLWPESLKTMIVRILVNFDESLFANASAELDERRRGWHVDDKEAAALAEMVQTVFELHLDIYCLIKSPNSGVENETVVNQGDRLRRWAELSREVMQFCREDEAGQNDGSGVKDALSLRFLWATTFHIGASDNVSQDHVIECMSDLRATFVEAGEPSLQLQNNAIMPELSISALDREVSKLTTRDFFLKITNQDVKEEPAAVIESLEPLLECVTPGRTTQGGCENPESTPPPLANPELVRFLESSHISIKLLLWQRLRDAYSNIEYIPMVVYCYLRMIRMVLQEMRSPDIVSLAQSDRQVSVLKSLRLLREMVTKIYTLVHANKDALECIDETGLKLAVSSFGEILQLLQVFNVAQDSIRVGQSQPPSQANGSPLASFTAVTTIIHEMQIQLWIVLYSFLKEAIAQNQDQYLAPIEDRFDFLRTVHRNLGLRGICGVANRAFVRMLKDELFQMTHVEGYDSEQAQVLYDLYGINCFLNPSYELIEHRCTRDAFLDRGVALQATDLLLAQASKLPMKELVKHSLKDTIEKVHGALPKKKATDAILKNRDIYRGYLRSPINPLTLFDCLKGEGNHIAVTPVAKNEAPLACKGWYFLMGQMALTRFRTQKRTAPTPIEDVEIAIAFFMQDLEYSADRWETWYRLGQAYDTKIEENVVWSAEKLNSQMPEITILQKNAIHCYTMATTLAHRSANLAFDTSDKMAGLYEDFATRLYSSSREPFSMQPFALQEEVDRFVTKANNVCKDKSFRPLRVYAAWKLANVLFGRALARQPDNWMLHYMVGKCRWKMHAAPDALRLKGETRDVPPTGQDVLASFVRALELLPEKDRKEGKDSKREPVLEPHYKLVSITHKLVSRGSITLQEGIKALEHSHYSRHVTHADTLVDWPGYVLTVLRKVRAADKSNWYHRMIARAAHIKYSTPTPDYRTVSNATAAKNELMGDLFTKTMVLQVWRPEAERPGRHFVYTARYTRFLVKILKELGDRANMEALARRVRRRPHDIFEHSLVWQDICAAYISMLRAYAELNEGLETSTFSNIAHEEFLVRKEPLEKWMEAQDPGTSRALDVMREVQELKKFNGGLMKPGAIDDLIGDSYASLFNGIGRTLWEDLKREQKEEEARRAPVSPPRSQVMSLNHLMNMDGASDLPPPVPPPQANPAVPESAASGAAKKIGVGRKTGVGRREIRACAEAGVQKPTATQAKKDELTATVIRPAQVVIPRHPPLNVSAQNSVPGSLQDSADDESELSELEEEGEEEGEEESESDNEGDDEAPQRQAPVGPRLMFPGLASVGPHGRQDAEAQNGDEVEVNILAAALEQDDDVEMQDGSDGDGQSRTGQEMEAPVLGTVE